MSQKTFAEQATGCSEASNAHTRTIIQYVVVRSDLRFGNGAIAANVAHASVAAIVSSIQMPNTRDYVDDLSNMRTVVLKVSSYQQLTDLYAKLYNKSYMWIEQPENVPVALATYPCCKEDVSDVFASLKLL